MIEKTGKSEHLRGAILGFGNMAEKGHLPGWLKQKQVAIQAICDPRPERRNRAKEILPSVRTYASQEDLYAGELLDFVDICTPPPFHAGTMVEALRQGLHVLCEKPFVGSRREFHKVLQLASQKKRVAFPAHNWKHAPILAKAQHWVEKGLLGRILHSEFHTLRMRPAVGLTPWRGQKENAGGGGILLDHGWHGIYLLLRFHRERPSAVSAWMDPTPGARGDGEQTVLLQIEFPRSTASLFLTWNAPRRYNSARIYGDQGLLTLEDDRLLCRTSGRPDRRARYLAPLSHGSHHPEWTALVLKDFLLALEQPEKAARALEEAFFCLEITLSAYASGRRHGCRVKIPTRME